VDLRRERGEWREEARVTDCLYAALERIPLQLEALQDVARESPQKLEEEPESAEPRPAAGEAQEGVHRPWWRRVLGG
jgi:hypothetical protein